MTNEEEREAKTLLDCWRHVEDAAEQLDIGDRVVKLAERLLAENSELRVRDSNVTMHSLNVMAVNEDLQEKLAAMRKIVADVPDTNAAFDQMLVALGIDYDGNPL